MVGIHIRRTDFGAEWESPDNLFYDKIQEILTQNPGQKIFLCSDDADLKKSIEMTFRGNIVTRSTRYRYDSGGLEDSVVDLFLLSKCTKIYGTRSGFCRLAAYIGGVDCQLICRTDNTFQLSIDDCLNNSFVISTSLDDTTQFYNSFLWAKSKPKMFNGCQPTFIGSESYTRALRHLEVVKMAKCLNLPYVTIFEDCARPMKNLKNLLGEWFSFAEIPCDADILVLGNLTYIYEYQGCLYDIKPIDNCKRIGEVGRSGVAGSHAYMVF